MHRYDFSVTPSLCVLVWTVIGLLTTPTYAASHDPFRQVGIDRFLASRRGFDIMCLYTFDRFRPSVNASAPPVYNSSHQDAADDHLLVTIPPVFEEHVGSDCPFGDLQFDPELVTSLNDGKSTSQLGVHVSEDSQNDVKRPQIASNDVVPAKEFFMWATSNGFSFEFSYRRRIETNQTMTLFSIGNRFGSCVDPGLRVDLTSTHVIMLVDFIPVLVGNDIACYERRLFSARTSRCVMPRYRSEIDDNPVVHVVVTVDAMLSQFYMKYVDPVTMETYECSGFDAMKPPDEPIEYDYIQGTYRLFLGNNPRNVSAPLKRSRIAPVRQYRNPDWDDRLPEEKLRDMIKQKLKALQGPRLPASFRLFGGQSLSMSVLSVDLPPVNEDTPFKWMRNAIEDFKKEHGDDIVEFIIKSLREGDKTKDFGLNATTAEDATQGDQGNVLSDGVYPNANGSTFDMFHFAIYRKPVSVQDVEQAFWSSWMAPSRPFMELKRTIRIQEDEEVLLELLQLHSIYDDIKLEIVQLPELGFLLLHPNKTALTTANVQHFRELPMDQQQMVYFVPKPRENNKNIKNGGLGRQFEPYAVIRFRIWKSTVGRKINTTREGVIEIWVDPVDDAPRTKSEVVDVDVSDKIPAYLDLKGPDDDESSTNSKKSEPSMYARQLGLFDGLAMLGKNMTTRSTVVSAANQNIRILELPRYGHLYDRNMENITERLRSADTLDCHELEPYRIHREWIANRSFSTRLVYIHDSGSVETTAGGVDSLQYQVRVGSSPEYSAKLTIKLHLLSPSVISDNSTENDSTLVGIYQVEEDSAITVRLLEIEKSLDPSGRFKVEQLPRHGKLYQYRQLGPDQPPEPTAQASIGSLIHSRAIYVDDVAGRLVYVPDANYFNSVPDELEGKFGMLDNSLDSFSYSLVSHAPLSDSMGTRLVQLRVSSTPDELNILPPTIVSTNCTRGEPVKVPVIFEDPDGFLGTYRVVLDTKDSSSTLTFGHTITDDDVLKYCPFERPCNLIRSANENYVSNENGDKDERAEWQLLYHVKSRTWNPSKIDVQGSKTALEYALKGLVFRDMSKWTWQGDHTSRFDVTISRLDSAIEAKTKITYYIDFVSADGDDDTDSLGQALSNLADLVSMGLWIAVMCFVLSSASCFSMGFCCCCTRARREKRHRFEGDRRKYVEQVVQNNHEYSALLRVFVDILGDSDLRLVETLLRICRGTVETERSMMEVLCLKSLTPILDTEAKFPNLVAHLLSAECHEQSHIPIHAILAYPSLASITLVHFCNSKAGAWLRHFRHVLFSTEFAHQNNSATQLINVLEAVLSTLPVEVVRLCQRFADIISMADDADRTMAIHVVFFNHFVGPDLWFTMQDSHGKRLRQSRQRKLQEAVRVLASFGWQTRTSESLSPGDEEALARYKVLLQVISTSSMKPDSLHEAVETDIDANLMGACLMNLHSILERVLPALEADEKARETAHKDGLLPLPNDEDVGGELDITTACEIKRLLHALNFPVASSEALVAISSGSMFADDPLLWNGFSIDEWQARVTEVRPTKHAPALTKRRDHEPPTFRHGQSLLAVDVAQDEDASTTGFESSRSDQNDHRVEFEF